MKGLTITHETCIPYIYRRLPPRVGRPSLRQSCYRRIYGCDFRRSYAISRDLTRSPARDAPSVASPLDRTPHATPTEVRSLLGFPLLYCLKIGYQRDASINTGTHQSSRSYHVRRHRRFSDLRVGCVFLFAHSESFLKPKVSKLARVRIHFVQGCRPRECGDAVTRVTVRGHVSHYTYRDSLNT